MIIDLEWIQLAVRNATQYLNELDFIAAQNANYRYVNPVPLPEVTWSKDANVSFGIKLGSWYTCENIFCLDADAGATQPWRTTAMDPLSILALIAQLMASASQMLDSAKGLSVTMMAAHAEGRELTAEENKVIVDALNLAQSQAWQAYTDAEDRLRTGSKAVLAAEATNAGLESSHGPI